MCTAFTNVALQMWCLPKDESKVDEWCTRASPYSSKVTMVYDWHWLHWTNHSWSWWWESLYPDLEWLTSPNGWRQCLLPTKLPVEWLPLFSRWMLPPSCFCLPTLLPQYLAVWVIHRSVTWLWCSSYLITSVRYSWQWDSLGWCFLTTDESSIMS